jgi:hypothetical protein
MRCTGPWRERVVGVAGLGVLVRRTADVPGAEGGHHLLDLQPVAVVEHPCLVLAVEVEAGHTTTAAAAVVRTRRARRGLSGSGTPSRRPVARTTPAR